MSLRRNITTGDIKDIDDAQLAAWIAAGNPKGAHYRDAWEPYTPPEQEPAVPDVVSKWQFWKQVTRQFSARGVTREAVRALLGQLITDPIQLSDALIDFDEAATVQRSNPLVPLIAQVYQISDAELDELFTEAAKL